MKPLFALLLIPLLGCNGIVSFQTGEFFSCGGLLSQIDTTIVQNFVDKRPSQK